MRISQSAYTHAEYMLAEKARREATGKQCLQVQYHSGDANKMVEDHFRDAAKMTKLQAQNRELVERVKRLEEALDTLTLVVGLTPIAGNKDALQAAMDIARSELKAKEIKP